MIERKFEAAEGTETVGFSHGDFSLVVQTLDNSAGKQLGYWGATEQKTRLMIQATDSLGLRSGGSSPRWTASGTEKAYRPSRLMCSKTNGDNLATSGGGVQIPDSAKPSFLARFRRISEYLGNQDIQEVECVICFKPPWAQ